MHGGTDADERSATATAHRGGGGLTVGRQVAMLRAAGFTTTAPVWQCGEDHVLVAVL